jgi:hypothetical protein
MSLSVSPVEQERAFDFTLHMRRVCADMCARLSELEHIDIHRVAIALRRARKRVPHGLQASLTPLRFAGGQLWTDRPSGRWTIQRVYDAPGGKEYLYILNFYLPRFLNHSFEEKLVTILHELWHIGPRFDGDLRRHPGRCYIHSGRQDQYDAWAGELSRKWLSLNPPQDIYGFLRYGARELLHRHRSVTGTRIPTPKLIRQVCLVERDAGGQLR